MSTIASLDDTVYYKEQYWDAFPQAKAYIQRQVSGDPRKDSLVDFKERYCKKPFKHGLFLNCGNGWLERYFIKHHMVEKATAFDYSAGLIEEAESKKKGLPITYFQADANTIDLPGNTFDLVVNSASLHHVQFLNRLCHQILISMKPNGIFFHYDYIGPHRNQYLREHWHLINEVNDSLPHQVRKDPLVYPHLPTMMVTDPSEAVHSELIIDTLDRFFDTKERHDISGMIAYNILSLNNKLHRNERNQYIEKVLRLDKEAYDRGEIPPLFTYMLQTPKKQVLKNTHQLSEWQRVENRRERLAGIIEHTYSAKEYRKLIEHGKKIPRLVRLALYLISKMGF